MPATQMKNSDSEENVQTSFNDRSLSKEFHEHARLMKEITMG